MTHPLMDHFTAARSQMQQWRHHLHAHPELGYDLPLTAAFVAERLRDFGCDEVVEGVGRSGVVGVIAGGRPGPVTGLRAEMDALPIEEDSGVTHASRHPGKMHACGHDGHSATLLGAAQYLAANRDFAGRAVVIFQPAEEGGAGAREMLRDGLVARFGVERVFALHNRPGLAEGAFALRSGAMMASVDEITLSITGRGGHAARPHLCVDPLQTACAIAGSLQTLVARHIEPAQQTVVSVTRVAAGNTYNVIPQKAELWGTVRTLSHGAREAAEAHVRRIVHAQAQITGAEVEIGYVNDYPVLVNHESGVAEAAAAARAVVGACDTAYPPSMGGEDFAFMLGEIPGAMIFLGAGDGPGLHHPAYDYNDALLPIGAAWLVALVTEGS